MPNHVLNKLTIQGPEDLVAKIRSEISSINEDGEQMLIDFNKIAPLPEELKGTRSPVMIISQKDYDSMAVDVLLNRNDILNLFPLSEHLPPQPQQTT